MFTDFYEAYNYLKKHPIFTCYPFDSEYYVSKLEDCIFIDVVKVNPETLSIDDNDNLNTKVQVWLEAGPYLKTGEKSHDYNLDCGADTFEEAIVMLANLVKEHYTSDKDEALKRVAENYY